MAKRFNTLDALVAAAPCELGTTDWVTVSQEDVSQFAAVTRAREWIHTNVDRAAREGPFGTTVAHGFLTLSLATHFQTELLDVPDDLVGVNYGVQRARFPAPLPVGTRVRAAGGLIESELAGTGARIVVRLVYEAEGGGKPPCVAEMISLVVPA
jgi:acyl dehydratase